MAEPTDTRPPGEDAAAPRKRRRRPHVHAPGAEWAGRVAEVAAVLAFASAPLMIGSVPTWAAAVGFGLSALAFLAVLAAAHLRGATLPVPVLALALGAVLVFEALQLVPLPPALLALLSPRGAGLQAFALEDLGAWPAFRPLHLDPIQGGLELARHLTAFLLYLSVTALAESRSRLVRLEVAFVFSGLAVVILAFTQRLLGLEHIYGLWPTPPQGWLFASFVNPNHFGAYLDLMAPVALGLALSTRDRSKALLWGLCFALLGSALLLTLSRGAIAAFLVGLTVLAALSRRVRTEGRPAATSWRSVAAPLLVGLAVSMAGYLALEPILGELATLTRQEDLADEARLVLWSESLPAVRDFWLTGLGRGAFAVAYPIYRLAPGARTFVYAENQPLQAFVELGIPFALLLVLGFLWQWGRCARRPELSFRQAGLLAGLAALAVHELADFATAFGGVALPAAAAFGLVVRGARRRVRPGPAMALALLGLGLGALGLGRAAGHRADEDLASLHEALAAGTPVEEAVRPLVLRRPTDHMLPLVAARELLARGGDPARALWWVGRAMYLSPTEVRGHLLAAELLARAGRGAQARLEYRLAVELGHPAAQAVAAAGRRWPDPALLREVVPESAQLSVVRWLTGRARHGEAHALLTELRAGAPEDDELLAALASAAATLGRHEEVEGLGALLTSRSPEKPQGWMALASSRLARREVEGAVAALEQGLERSPGSVELSMMLAGVHLAPRKDPDAALKVLDVMRLPPSPAARARLHLTRGRAHRLAGRTRAAVDALRTASRLTPEDPSPLMALGDLYMEGQQWERGLATYREAAATANAGRAGAALAPRLARAQEKVRALEAFRKREAIYGDGDLDLPVPD